MVISTVKCTLCAVHGRQVEHGVSEGSVLSLWIQFKWCKNGRGWAWAWICGDTCVVKRKATATAAINLVVDGVFIQVSNQVVHHTSLVVWQHSKKALERMLFEVIWGNTIFSSRFCDTARVVDRSDDSLWSRRCSMGRASYRGRGALGFPSPPEFHEINYYLTLCGRTRASNYVIKYAHAVKPISCPRRRRFTSGVRHVEKENGRVFRLC